MNLKDLARVAGVSPSTISKVINGKDSSISTATRERILALIKDYNCQIHSSALPYSSKSFMIGVILQNFEDNVSLLDGITKEAQSLGYSVVTRFSSGDHGMEEKNIAILSSHHVDALIWEPVDGKSLDLLPSIEKNGIQAYLYNAPDGESFHLDYSPFSFAAAKTLIEMGHTNIACVSSRKKSGESFLSGYRSALFENDILVNPSLIFQKTTEELLQKILSHAVTAVITESYTKGVEVFHAAASRNVSVPTNLSILTLSDENERDFLSSIPVPFVSYGRYLCRSLISRVEKKDEEIPPFTPQITLTHKNTVSIPFQALPKRVLVVGSINIDNYLKVNALPRSGKTVISSSASFYAGGKALNEAVGLAKLGLQVSVIGCVGSDSDSDLIFDTLRHNGIDKIGIRRAVGDKTGQAYIFVQDDGESIISIMPGANAKITPSDIEGMKSLFENTAFCLLQTEIPMASIMEACRMAKKNHATTILKPTACGPLSSDLLGNVDIIVPNREELRAICPGYNTVEEQSDYLLKQGVSMVVATLDADGCYIRRDGYSKYFDASPFPAVDVSGAADAFISALTAYLYRGSEIPEAAEIANYAAGYSISKEGVIPSLISRQELEKWVQSSSQKRLQ